jgi:hypothetical protein
LLDEIGRGLYKYPDYNGFEDIGKRAHILKRRLVMADRKMNPRIDNDIIALAGYWEPISFTVRGGRAYKGIYDDNYPYSEKMAKHLSEIGISTVIWHYYKGLGIKTEEEEMRKTAKFFKACDKYGLIKGVYINFGSVFADTFFSENPEYSDWPSLDQYGQYHQYSEFYRCYYRLRPCCTHKEYSNYVAKAAIKAIGDGADVIFFDNSAQMPCYCDNCKKMFPEYVLNKFPQKPKAGQMSFKERFGYDYTGSFVLPRGTTRRPIDTLPAANDPGFYEWVRYRQNLYEQAMKNTAGQIRGAWKDAKISWNIALDFGEFSALVWGLDPEISKRCPSDSFFSEDENYAGIEDGRLISHIRTYRYGYAMGNKVLIHNTISADDERRFLNFAEAAAFNGGCLGRVMWATQEDDGSLDIIRKALKFFRANKDVYIKSKPISSVAVYRSAESEVMNWSATTVSRLAVEHILIDNSIQYDYLINDTIQDIFKYKVLVCANLDSVSDANVAIIREFVKRGGKVFCTEQSFRRDEYGYKRVAACDMGLVGERDSGLGKDTNRANVSKVLKDLGLEEKHAGSIYYVPEIQYSKPFAWDPQVVAMPVIGKDYYAEPVNAAEILGLLRQAIGPDSEFEITGPENVIGGYFETANGGCVAHVFDFAGGRVVSGVKVRFRTAKPVKKAVFKTLTSEAEVAVSRSGAYSTSILPDFRAYGFLKCEF